MRAQAEAALFDRLALTIDDPSLRELALTHPSYTRELGGPPEACNERLEFLGDAVIQLAISLWLYAQFPHLTEGQLTRLRSFVVRGSQLAEAGRRLGLGEALYLGHGTERTGGRRRTSILADAFEAICGAALLEHGWNTAQDAVLRWLAPEIEAAVGERLRNWKGELQELTQSNGGELPAYRLVDSSGPSHAPQFVVEVSFAGEALARGEGSSKKLAEQRAAQTAWEELTRRSATSPAEPTPSEGTPS